MKEPASEQSVHPSSTPAVSASTPVIVTLPYRQATAAPSGISGAIINENYKDVPNSNMRKVIAKRLAESKATVPHFYVTGECTIDDLMGMRKAMKKDMNINISVNDIVIKSAALALRDVPITNSKFDVKAAAVKNGNTVDISVAVATPNGLITPIVTTAVLNKLLHIKICMYYYF